MRIEFPNLIVLCVCVCVGPGMRNGAPSMALSTVNTLAGWLYEREREPSPSVSNRPGHHPRFDPPLDDQTAVATRFYPRFSSRGRRASWLPSFIFSFLPLVSTIVKCLERGWMEKGKLEFFGINSNKVWIIFSRTRKYLTDFGTREKINPKSWPIQQFLQIFSSNGKRSN